MESIKLPLKTKIGFGACDLGGNLFFTIVGFYLLSYLTDNLGMLPFLAGIAFGIGKIWDAVCDISVGYISDKTRSRWGRRRPFIFAGGILLFVTMIIMFTNFHISGRMPLFIWVTVSGCLLFTSYALVNIPYGALTTDLTKDYNEVTELNGFRMTFAVIGTLAGAVLTQLLVNSFSDKNVGWTVTAGIMGFLMMASSMTTFFSVKEVRASYEEKKNIFQTYYRVLKNKPFIIALAAWTLHITGVTVVQASIKYYFKFIYYRDDLFPFALLCLLFSVIVSIPLWVMLSGKLGKKVCYNAGMLIFAFSILLFFFFGEFLGVIFSFIVMCLSGIGFATQYVMPYALVPDIIEYNFSVTGERNEGSFYGLWTFLSKAGQAAALVLSGFILTITGYSAELPYQSVVSKFGIKILCGPLPVFFFIAGVIVLSFYPINREFYEKVLEKNKSTGS
jgi:glycoside/pentoside/hexuronide:cation symporter, GPH family